MKTAHPPTESSKPTTSAAQRSTGLDRRQFVKYSFGVAAGLSVGAFTTACGGSGQTVATYHIVSM